MVEVPEARSAAATIRRMTPPRLLPDLTMQRERKKMREAAIDVLCAHALARPIEALIEKSPYHAQLARSSVMGDPALGSPWAVFVQDTIRPATVLGQLAPFTWPAQPGAPVVDVGVLPVGDFVPEGSPWPMLDVPILVSVAEISKITFGVSLDARLFEMGTRAAIEQVLAAAIAAAEDNRLLDDEPAAPGERPAGLRHGAPVFSAAGTSPAEIAAAFGAAIASVRGGHKVAIATEDTIAALPLNVFPDARTDGTGALGALPLIIAKAGPPLVVIAAANAIAVVDGGVEITVGRGAAVDYTQPPLAQPAQLTSLWQTNSIGLRATRLIWWCRASDGSAVLDLGLSGS